MYRYGLGVGRKKNISSVPFSRIHIRFLYLQEHENCVSYLNMLLHTDRQKCSSFMFYFTHFLIVTSEEANLTPL